MSCLGVHFSLSVDEVNEVLAIEDEAERVEFLHSVIEEEYFAHRRERIAESDKAWDAIHRTLGDGTLAPDGGAYPLNQVVLGGEPLYSADDFIMTLKTPDRVRDVAAALPAVSEAEFRRRYFAIDPLSYGMPLSEEDFGYTWDNFQAVREFWMHAADEGRHVLFTADQ
jgi:hypothetical protein